MADDHEAAPAVAVVGHVEWLMHARGSFPAKGEIALVTDVLEEPAGGGAVTAVKAARLGARCLFFTALGDDAAGTASAERLRELGLELHAARRPMPQTRALSVSGPDGDRSIAVIGGAVGPAGDDDLPWPLIASCDAAYFTGYDERSLRAARAARVLVSTARRAHVLRPSDVALDVLVMSANDPGERLDPADLAVAPRIVMRTDGSRGGTWETRAGERGHWESVAPPGPVIDTYGAGDSFLAGVMVGLARNLPIGAAAALGAEAAARCVTARGGLAR